MKIAKSLLVALVLTMIFIACKKDTVEPAFTVEGTWEGKLGNGSSVPTGMYKLNIKKNGAIERINSDGNASATGTWEVSGNDFSATYVFADDGTVVEVDGLVDVASKKISGTWSNDGGGGGKFYVTKVQK